ncbi:hypothetical protein C5167_002334 [Papaver somniferum]|uniref:Uncharacterized protein n=1 Tax=Papaver somniferum TaxID=3469 RepID=A0A4Y7KTT6_PAPSO|nr:hypothetical protein C5167_002334 [Papaver somniferum]
MQKSISQQLSDCFGSMGNHWLLWVFNIVGQCSKIELVGKADPGEHGAVREASEISSLSAMATKETMHLVQ